MAPRNAESHVVLLLEAGKVLGTSQVDIGRRIGVSRRTMTRWMRNPSCLVPLHAQALARAVYPVDPALAARCARVGETTLEALGLEVPTPRDPPRHHADAVVCAAAEALDASPRAVRPVLLAAVRKAREVGLTVEQLERLLAPPARAEK